MAPSRTTHRDITSIRRLDPPDGYVQTERHRCFGQWEVELGMGRRYLVSHIEIDGMPEVAVARFSSWEPGRVDWRESRIYRGMDSPMDAISELMTDPPKREERDL